MECLRYLRVITNKIATPLRPLPVKLISGQKGQAAWAEYLLFHTGDISG
jgi:hypothetical protein